MERKLNESRAAAQSLVSEKRQLQDEGQEMIKLRAQLEFQVKDLEGNIDDERSTKVSCDP